MAEKCENCGSEMMRAFVKGSTLETWFCPNLCGNVVRNHITRIKDRILIPCGNIDPDSLSATFTRLMLEGLNEATRGAMSNAELMEHANRAIGVGINPADVFGLFGAFTTLGMRLGKKPKYSVESGVYGIVNKSRKRLDNLGIYVWTKDAYAAYPELDKDEAWIKYMLERVREAATR